MRHSLKLRTCPIIKIKAPTTVNTFSPISPTKSCPKKAVTTSTSKPHPPQTGTLQALCFLQPSTKAPKLTGTTKNINSWWNRSSAKDNAVTEEPAISARGIARQCNTHSTEIPIAVLSSNEDKIICYSLWFWAVIATYL